MAGPPLSLFPLNITDAEQEEISDGKIYLILAKLASFNRALPPLAADRLSILSKKYPTWRLADNQSDEFASWSESYYGYKADLTTEELFALPKEELVTKLQENCPEYHDGRLESFANGAKEPAYYPIVVEVLKHLKDQDIWEGDIWKSALSGLAESSIPSWSDVAPLLAEFDPSFLAEFSWTVAWWVRKTSKLIEPNVNEEKYFWEIVNKVLFMKPEPLHTAVGREIYTEAINHSVGIITEAILNRLGCLKLKKNQGIPKENFLNCFDQLISEKQDSYVLGRVILASQLMYLYNIDPTWTKEKLLPKLNWSNSQEAPYIWQGYLTNPHISIELASELKEDVLVTLTKGEMLSDRLEQLHRLFALICLETPDLYSTTEKQEGLKSIGVLGLKNVAKFIWQGVAHNSESENYWQNRIKPFIVKAWPKDKKYASPEISHFLARMMDVALNSLPASVKIPVFKGHF